MLQKLGDQSNILSESCKVEGCDTKACCTVSHLLGG